MLLVDPFYAIVVDDLFIGLYMNSCLIGIGIVFGVFWFWGEN
jgi:hypothetical protein